MIDPFRFPIRRCCITGHSGIAGPEIRGTTSLSVAPRDGADGGRGRRRTWSSVVALSSLLVLACVAGCQTSDGARQFSRLEALQAVENVSDASSPGLVLGEYRLHPTNPIMDGDTIRVEGLDASLRLLAIDTEETFKNDQERAAYRAGWEEYKRAMRGDSPRPVKMATPLGEEATRWAEEFFKGTRVVRLERDHPGEIRGFYNRFLVYVFAEKDGEWVNYNLECVRAGMSPYFQKYGRSRRFHEEFVQAQEEARAAKRGIWSDDGEHYDDYDERLKWWDARGNSVWTFEEQAKGKPNWIVLTRFDSMLKLRRLVDQEVVVLGTVGSISEKERGPTIVNLSKDRNNDLSLVFFDPEVLQATGITSLRGEYVAARGKVSLYRSRLQIVVNEPGQIITPAEDGALVVAPASADGPENVSQAAP